MYYQLAYFYKLNPIPNDSYGKYIFYIKDAPLKLYKQHKEKMILSFKILMVVTNDSKRLYIILRQDINFENYIDLPKMPKQKNSLEKRKRGKWMKYTGSINCNTDPQNVWLQIRNIKNENPVVRVNRYSTEEFSESLLKSYAPDLVRNLIHPINLQKDHSFTFDIFIV